MSSDPNPSPAPSSPSQKRALGVFALGAVAALVWLCLPVASGLFLGTVLAFSLLGVYGWLSRRLGRPALAAAILTVGTGLVVVGTLVVLLYFVVARGIEAANTIAHGFEPGGALRVSLAHLDEGLRKSGFGGGASVTDRVREAAASAAAKMTTWAAAVASVTFGAFLLLLFTLMTMYFVLRHWKELADQAERMLPLNPIHTREVLAEFEKVGKEVFIGTMLTGLIQGTLAGIGYAIAGVSEAAMLGALTALGSLVPAVGTLLVWVSVGVVLLLSGHPAAGVFELIWGALVVGIVSDYVIRPRFVGRKSQVPTLVTFIALFGGVAVFGLIGLIIGPVITSVALAIQRTYDRERAPTLDAV